MYKAGLIGVTGYTGMELARILATHPQIELTHATSRQESGKKIEDLYPFLRSYKIGSVCISDYDAQELAKECDIIFLPCRTEQPCKARAKFSALRKH